MRNCTIIIPTKNRLLLFDRLISFYKLKNIDNPLLIGDSTGYSNKQDYGKLKNVKIVKYKPDVGIFDKLADIGKYVKTEYCVISADDDFLIPQALDLCVKFLMYNKDFSICMGQDYQMASESPVLIEECLSKNPIINISKNDRCLSHLSKYVVNTYGVYRTEDFKYIWNETKKYKNEGVWAELFGSILALSFGKMMVFDLPYSVRTEQEISDSSGAKGIYDHVADGSYKRRYGLFMDGLVSNGFDKKSVSVGWKKYTKHYHWFLKDRLAYWINKINKLGVQ